MYDDQLTTEWQQYQDGIDYNNTLDYYNNYDKNEAFYTGNQWRGVQANGLPTPVFNIFKRVINYFIASILSQKTTIQFSAENIPDEPTTTEELQIKEAVDIISDYSKDIWEKCKIENKLQDLLLDASLSGDACIYNTWNSNDGGYIEMEIPDGGNVFFGNPNDRRVQTQPYILISYRELVSKLKQEAKNEKLSQEEIDKIVSDSNTEHQAGDMGKIELNNQHNKDGKVTVLLKFWRNKDTIFWNKSTKFVEIIKNRDTMLNLYPIAWMNWDRRKNTYHGQSIATGLIPNQVFINKLFAMAMISLQHAAFPRIIYDKSKISAISNQIGAAIGIDTAEGSGVSNSVSVLKGADMSSQVIQLIDLAIKYTKDMLGASDAALGQVKPENTSAILAVSQQASVPLETIKQNLWQLIEDMGYIWFDYMANYYGIRKIPVSLNGTKQIIEFDFSILKKIKPRVKIDVGASTYWSEIANMQTLDNLLNSNRITFLQYLERIPKGIVPKLQELIDDLNSQTNNQQNYEQMAQFVDSLPPDVQNQIKALPPDQMEATVMQLMQNRQP